MADNPGDTLYLVGTSGHPNYGDEFITASWLKYLAEARPDAEVWLDCPNPGQASHLFGTLHPRVNFTDSLFRLVWETRDMARDEADELIRHRMHHLGSPRFDLGLLGVRRATSVHVLGGAYINDHWPFHVGLLRAAATLREITDVRLAATGLALTPAANEDRLLEALKAFDHVSVRDTPSAELTGATLGPDDAFLGVRELPGFGGEPQQTQDGEVWVCLQQDLSSPDAFDAAVEATRKALTSPELEGREVHYLEAMPGVDRIAYDRLSDLIPEENFLSFVRVWHGSFPARSGQTWITTRFHLHLLAAASGASGTALAIDEDQHPDTHRSLVEAGTGWSLTPVGADELSPASVSKGFPYRSRMVSQEKIDEAKQLYPAAPKPKPEPEQPAAAAAAEKRRGWRSRW